MRFLAKSIAVGSIAIGSLMLIGALPATAGQSADNTQLAAGTTSTSDRDTYTHAMRDDMQQWQQKIHDFSELARAKGQQADNATENALNIAWANTQVESRKVSAASAEGWASAKASYEQASHELANAWDKVSH